MKIHRIPLTADEQKKLDQVMAHLKIKSVKAYLLLKIGSDWLAY